MLKGWDFISELRVIYITINSINVLDSLIDSSINIVGVIENSKYVNNVSSKIEEYCYMNEIPYYLMNEGCNDRIVDWLTNLKPDLIVVNQMYELLKPNIIEIPRLGCINLHPTLLPKYRGKYPIFWTFYYIDLKPGVTIHYIDKGEDTGDIIYQETVEITLGLTEEEFMGKLVFDKGSELLIRAIVDIEKNCAPRIKQPKESPTERARQILPSEYKSIINWEDWEIERIWHLLRGTQNWLDVFDFTKITGKVKKWHIRNFRKKKIMKPIEPGKVYYNGEIYLVYCRQGEIYLDLDID